MPLVTPSDPFGGTFPKSFGFRGGRIYLRDAYLHPSGTSRVLRGHLPHPLPPCTLHPAGTSRVLRGYDVAIGEELRRLVPPKQPGIGRSCARYSRCRLEAGSASGGMTPPRLGCARGSGGSEDQEDFGNYNREWRSPVIASSAVAADLRTFFRPRGFLSNNLSGSIEPGSLIFPRASAAASLTKLCFA